MRLKTSLSFKAHQLVHGPGLENVDMYCGRLRFHSIIVH